MRLVGSIGIISLLALSACSNPSGSESSEDDTAGTALRYHCPVTGEDPEGPDLWLEIKGSDASLSHDPSFATVSAGALDPTYKPTQRVNMDRFRGFDGWTPGGTTTVYVNKSLEAEGGGGDIFLDTVTTKFTETVYACHAIDDQGSTCAWSGYAGALATFAFDGDPGSEASVAGVAATGGVTSSALSRSLGLTPTKASGSLSASHWGTGESADAGRYFTFTITPASGCTLSLDAVRVGLRASTTGPKAVDIATSADGFAAHTASVPGTSEPTASLTATSSGAIEIRIYGYQASSSAGTLRIVDTVTLSGEIQ